MQGTRVQPLLLLVAFFGINEVHGSGNAMLEAQTKDKQEDKKHTICVQYNSKFSEIANSLKTANPMTLIDLSNLTGCSAEDFKHNPSSFAGSAVAVSRGECTFAEKAALVQSMNGSSVVVVDYSNSSHTGIPEGNSSSYHEINIIVTCVALQDYHEVLSLPRPVEVRIYKLESSKFDPNMIVIIVASTLIIFIASFWTAYEEKAGADKSRPASDLDLNSSEEENGSKKEKGVEITPIVVTIWVAFLCGILLLLYFFYDVMVFFFIGVFVLTGSHSMYICILPLWIRIVPFEEGIPMYQVPCIRNKVKFRSLLLLLICITVAIFWAIERHANFAWIIQDFMGATFCISIMRALRLPSLKILTFMMILLFCYDIFFVFITPFFTKNGQSVMINVATGGNSHSGEMIPLVFLIPLLSNSPDTMCRYRLFSLLGFGDVILPGFLIVYNAVFGVHARCRMYIFSAIFAYALGMGACLLALIFMDQGQPALLYLVPATLLSTFTVAFIRGEVSLMWKGHFPSSENLHAIVSEGQNGTNVGSDDRDEEEVLSCTPEEEEQRTLIG